MASIQRYNNKKHSLPDSRLPSCVPRVNVARKGLCPRSQRVKVPVARAAYPRTPSDYGRGPEAHWTYCVYRPYGEAHFVPDCGAGDNAVVGAGNH